MISSSRLRVPLPRPGLFQCWKLRSSTTRLSAMAHHVVHPELFEWIRTRKESLHALAR